MASPLSSNRTTCLEFGPLGTATVPVAVVRMTPGQNGSRATKKPVYEPCFLINMRVGGMVSPFSFFPKIIREQIHETSITFAESFVALANSDEPASALRWQMSNFS